MDTSDDVLVHFEFRPLVFKLPERGGAASPDLFVVVCGLMDFDRAACRDDDELQVRSFATQVGYFRHRGGVLSHVYGAHYDFAPDEVGHPAFHAQIKSFEWLAAEVRNRYGITAPVCDEVKKILRTVRIPTAHLDIFSVFLQLCADHLMRKDSGLEEKAAYNSLLEDGAFCQGAASRIARLSNEEAAHCYRSRHWYAPVS
jgi:hypothetical protein